jgi:hypothetical protein
MQLRAMVRWACPITDSSAVIASVALYPEHVSSGCESHGEAVSYLA